MNLSRTLFAALLLVESRAVAVENQHHIGLGPTGSALSVKDSSVALGAGMRGYYTYGLTDQLNLNVELGTGLFSSSRDPSDKGVPTSLFRPSRAGDVGVGVTYVLDVLRWVPYGGILAGGHVLGGGTTEKAVFVGGLTLALGLDYQFDRHWSFGGGFRQHMLLTKVSTYPVYSTFIAKFEYAWGY